MLLISNIYVSLSLVLPIKDYRAQEYLFDFQKKGKQTPKSHIILIKVTSSDSAYQKTLLKRFQAFICKNVEFCTFLPEDRSQMRFFSESDPIETVVIRREIKSSSVLLSEQNDWKATRSSHNPFFLKIVHHSPKQSLGKDFKLKKNCPLFTWSICYSEVNIHLSGGGAIFMLQGFSRRRLFHGEKFLGGSSDKFYNGGICQNSYTKFFLFLAFSMPTQFSAWRY